MEEDETLERLNTDPGPELKAIFERYGVVKVEPPPSMRSPWRRSYLVRRGDGEVTSLLQLMTLERYGTDYDPDKHDSYWLDRNYKNVSPANVGLYEKSAPKSGGRQKTQGIGAKSGTKEYYAAYRKKNREKIKAHHKAYRDRRANAVRKLEAMELEAKLPGNARGGLDIDDLIKELK